MEAEEKQITRTGWSILARHDWNGSEELITPLEIALEKLGALAGDAVVHDYVDVDAVSAVFGPAPTESGAHQLRFDCEGHEVRIDRHGVISARPHGE